MQFARILSTLALLPAAIASQPAWAADLRAPTNAPHAPAISRGSDAPVSVSPVVETRVERDKKFRKIVEEAIATVKNKNGGDFSPDMLVAELRNQRSSLMKLLGLKNDGAFTIYVSRHKDTFTAQAMRKSEALKAGSPGVAFAVCRLSTDGSGVVAVKTLTAPDVIGANLTLASNQIALQKISVRPLDGGSSSETIARQNQLSFSLNYAFGESPTNNPGAIKINTVTDCTGVRTVDGSPKTLSRIISWQNGGYAVFVNSDWAMTGLHLKR
jgi:hypothetical protein